MLIRSYHKSKEADMDVEAAPLLASKARSTPSPRRPAVKQAHSSPKQVVAAIFPSGTAISSNNLTKKPVKSRASSLFSLI